jgi:YD repeat-containing protein
MCTYDPNGNLASKTEGTDTWTYTWNAENQLTKVEKNGAEVGRFSYDPFGRRVRKILGGIATDYTYDRAIILRAVQGTTTLKHVHGVHRQWDSAGAQTHQVDASEGTPRG